MEAEAEDFEVKSQFDGSPRHWLRLVKTVMAMANSGGGRILIERVNSVQSEELDSARIDNKINKHIAPRIDDLRVKWNFPEDEKVYKAVLFVPNSPRAPHIVIEEGQYINPSGQHKREFYRGQIWVRHSASNAPATPDDIERILQRRASTLLHSLGALVLNTSPGVLASGSKLTLATQESDSPDALMVRHLEPYTAESLAQLTGKHSYWIGAAANYLGWRTGNEHDTKYMQAIPNHDGSKITQWRYTNEAQQQLERILKEDPSFSPFGRREDAAKQRGPM